MNMKTPEQIMDEYVVDYGYSNWEELFYDEGVELGDTGIGEIAERYASQFQDRIKDLEDMLVKSNEIIKILDSASSAMLNEIRRSTKNHDNRTYVFFNEQIETLINKNK